MIIFLTGMIWDLTEMLTLPYGMNFFEMIKIKELLNYLKYSFPSELRFSNSLLEQNNWHTNLIYPLFQTAGPRSPNSTSGATPSEFCINNFLYNLQS